MSIGFFSGKIFTLKFFLFRSLSDKLWAFCRKVFGHGFQNCILLLQKTRLKKNVFFCRKSESFLNVLWHWAKKCRPLSKKFFLQDCQNCNLSFYGKTLRRIVLKLFFSLFHCWTLSERVLAWWQKVLAWISKHSTYSKELYEKKNNIYFFCHSQTLRKKFRPVSYFLAEKSKLHSQWP